MLSFSLTIHLLLFLSLMTDICPAAHNHHTYKHGSLTYNETFRFITRPDIKAPRWVVNKYNEDRISTGYWFVAPFENLGQRQDDSGYGAVGAHIYDGDGDLIWSGVSTFHERNILDFTLSDAGGEESLTLIHQGDGNGVLLDHGYNISKVVNLGDPGLSSNPRELSFVSHGTRALVTTQLREHATKAQAKNIGRKQCNVLWQGFEEIDTATWQPVFRWESRAHIYLNESTLTDRLDDCDESWAWDYLHVNSVDKLPEGDYLLSARHTDAIYRISAGDGSVVWRLGGRRSDFDLGGERFTRQHDVRFRGRNSTHTFISFLDNARGEDSQKPSRWSSRAVMLALDTADMKATVEQAIEHPRGPGMWAWQGGNYQVLPNGNAFVGWSERALLSEHASDGTMVMQAVLVGKRLGTYRAYKFPFVGRPTTLPDVHSEAHVGVNDTTTTLVHVSWNGATEVHVWNLYKTTETNKTRILVASRRREGFETALAFDGFIAYVIVEALDRDGNILASSTITQTALTPVLNAAISEEVWWLQMVGSGQISSLGTSNVKSVFEYPLVPFAFGFICSAMMMLVIFLVPRKFEQSVAPDYKPLQQDLRDDSEPNLDRDGPE